MSHSAAKLKTGLWAAAIYIAIMGLGMMYFSSTTGSTYGAPNMVETIVWVEAILMCVCLYFIFTKFSWYEIGFQKIKWKQLIWLAPSGAILSLMIVSILKSTTQVTIGPEQMRLLFLTLLTTILVGFSEETMFRGILLRSALSSKSILLSIFISAVGFSVLHSVNLFGGLPGPSVGTQMVLTFTLGMFFAPLALKIGSLWPLIVFHSLWDFSVFGAGLVGASQSWSLMLPAVNVLLGAILWFQYWHVANDSI